MDLYLLRAPQSPTDATSNGVPCGDVVPVDAPRRPMLFGRVVATNPLEGEAEAAPEIGADRAVQRIICSSGRLPDEPPFRTWGPLGRDRFESWCDRVAPVVSERGQTVCFVPNALDVLSDTQACVTLLRKYGGRPFEILLDPVGLLTMSMLGRVEDHLARMYEALATVGGLGSTGGVAGVILSNLEVDGGILRRRPLHAGSIDPDLLTARCPPNWARVVVAETGGRAHEDDLTEQVALLRSSGQRG